MKSIFHHFLRAIIEANKTIFFGSSLIHFMCAIACAHASTRITNLMHAKKARPTFVYDVFCLEHWNEENENIKYQTE